ncbi:hypothetical protein BV20DRAFT_959474, partial [Pilatotrama ljubarskyi]
IPDQMHEFELGVWKSTMTHLVRILTTVGASAVNELNTCRFAHIPTFGRDTIRQFGTSAADLKKMAARDFEDLIQCAIPAFEGLLCPAHDALVRKLLFQLATWHALAKLRLHTDTTLAHFEDAVRALGQAMRAFTSKVCPDYETRELDKELAARQRRKAKKDKKGKAPAIPSNVERTRKEFNINTYKFHRLGDGPRSVRETGTLDITSTQTVSGALSLAQGPRITVEVHAHWFCRVNLNTDGASASTFAPIRTSSSPRKSQSINVASGS